MTSTLPTRDAAAVAIDNPEGLLLLARRSPGLLEFPGVWSLPSVYYVSGEDLWRRLTLMLANELAVTIRDPILIACREAPRPAWRIRMHVYAATIGSGPSLIGLKYDAIKWVTRGDIRERDSAQLGDCMLAYRDWMMGAEP